MKSRDSVYLILQIMLWNINGLFLWIFCLLSLQMRSQCTFGIKCYLPWPFQPSTFFSTAVLPVAYVSHCACFVNSNLCFQTVHLNALYSFTWTAHVSYEKKWFFSKTILGYVYSRNKSFSWIGLLVLQQPLWSPGISSRTSLYSGYWRSWWRPEVSTC